MEHGLTEKSELFFTDLGRRAPVVDSDELVQFHVSLVGDGPGVNVPNKQITLRAKRCTPLSRVYAAIEAEWRLARPDLGKTIGDLYGLWCVLISASLSFSPLSLSLIFMPSIHLGQKNVFSFSFSLVPLSFPSFLSSFSFFVQNLSSIHSSINSSILQFYSSILSYTFYAISDAIPNRHGYTRLDYGEKTLGEFNPQQNTEMSLLPEDMQLFDNPPPPPPPPLSQLSPVKVNPKVN